MASKNHIMGYILVYKNRQLSVQMNRAYTSPVYKACFIWQACMLRGDEAHDTR